MSSLHFCALWMRVFSFLYFLRLSSAHPSVIRVTEVLGNILGRFVAASIFGMSIWTYDLARSHWLLGVTDNTVNEVVAIYAWVSKCFSCRSSLLLFECLLVSLTALSRFVVRVTRFILTMSSVPSCRMRPTSASTLLPKNTQLTRAEFWLTLGGYYFIGGCCKGPAFDNDVVPWVNCWSKTELSFVVSFLFCLRLSQAVIG